MKDGKAFQIGKKYRAVDCGIDPITVIGRTRCYVFVDNSVAQWRMRVHVDEDGNEWATDSTAPKYWQNACTYGAIWEEES